jgi:hypothetical protein
MSHIEVSFDTFDLFTRALAARWVHHGGRHLTQEEAVREWALRELGSFGIVVDKPIGEAIDVDNAYAQAQHSWSNFGVEPLPTPGEAPESTWDAVKADVTRVFGTAGLRRAESLDSALAEAEEAEFTDPPATRSWPSVGLSGLVRRDDLGQKLAAAVANYDTEWPEGYKLYPGKAVTGGDRDITEPLIDSAGGYHFPLDWSADRRQAWYDEQKKGWHGEPETYPEVGGAGVPFEPVTPPEETLLSGEETRVKRRRTKAEMAEARGAVRVAYLTTVGDSPWSKGWDVAHEAGKEAAYEAGRAVELSPYQTNQVIGDAAQGAKTNFDGAPERVRTVLVGEDEVTVRESPAKPAGYPVTDEPDVQGDYDFSDARLTMPSDGTERVTWVEAGTSAHGPIIPGRTYNEDTTPDPSAEVAAIHGLLKPAEPSEAEVAATDYPAITITHSGPVTVSDDDIFRQFLNG